MKRQLNDVSIRNAKPLENGKPKKYTDGGGMYLYVTSTGKYWRYNYKYNNKYKTLAIGVYPDVSLKEARVIHEDARELLERGIDPSGYKKVQKANKALNDCNNFEAVAREWFERFKSEWVDSHAKKVLSRLENDVFPWIGERAISEIEPPEILMVLRRIESRGALETAHRTRQTIGQIFRYGVATGRAVRDQTADLKGALPAYRKKHFPAITDPKEMGQLMRVIDDYTGTFVVKCALRLSPLVMLRPSELAGAKWNEIDFDSQTWAIPIERMKAKKAVKEENLTVHVVPLSRQAVEILREIQFLTGKFEHVFTGLRDRKKPMSASTVNTALKRIGYQNTMKAHSFRAMASSTLNQMGYNPDAIERQLAHKDSNEVRAAYNRAEYLEERKRMLQDWADYLDSLKNGAEIIPIRKTS